MNIAKRSLLSAVVLAVLVGAAFIYVQIQAAAERNEKRQQLFADVDIAVRSGDRQGDDLSGLWSRLSELDESDRQVALAMSRIDVLRGRYERAAERLEPLMLGSRDLLELRTAAQAWLSWPLHGGHDASERRGLWREALTFAESAYEAGGEVEDLFRAWQAAARVPDDDARARIGQLLQERHGQCLEARTVGRMVASGDEDPGLVVDLLAEWETPPIELRLFSSLLRLGRAGEKEDLLQARDEVGEAVIRLDELLQAAPNFVEVRNLVATAHHMAGLAEPEGAERDRHLKIRDAQLAWLEKNAAADDPRRPDWHEMGASH